MSDDANKTLEAFPDPPEAWMPIRRMAQRVKAPVDHFLHTQTGGSIVLLVAAAVALAWANSPWHDTYHHFWETPISLGIGAWSMTESLHFWINDLLMTIFFMVVGFEIKRELVEGELSDLQRAALPVAAALGGMVVPALIYVAFNPTGPASAGWGVPMATDIAFAVGILGLLGKRVPAALRILLLALAIIDDIGAIMVIAIFYTEGIDFAGLIPLVGGLLLYLGLIRIGVRPGFIYTVPLIVMWAGMHQLGVHATMAGVIAGLLIPVKPWLSREQFLDVATKSIEEFQSQTRGNYDAEDVMKPLKRLTVAGREAVSPCARATAAFHPWVAYVIMPLFALANAGVYFGDIDLNAQGATTVVLGVALGLAVGKPLGIVGVTWVTMKLGLCKLPRGVTWSGITVLGCCAGIGFTVAIFISDLAFTDPATQGLSKLAILGATTAAAVMGLALGRIALPRELDPVIARLTPADVETSTEF